MTIRTVRHIRIRLSIDQHRDPNFTVTPQFWIRAQDRQEHDRYGLAFRDVTNPTDRRTFDACFIPHRYAGNTLPILAETTGSGT